MNDGKSRHRPLAVIEQARARSHRSSFHIIGNQLTNSTTEMCCCCCSFFFHFAFYVTFLCVILFLWFLTLCRSHLLKQWRKQQQQQHYSLLIFFWFSTIWERLFIWSVIDFEIKFFANTCSTIVELFITLCWLHFNACGNLVRSIFFLSQRQIALFLRLCSTVYLNLFSLQ